MGLHGDMRLETVSGPTSVYDLVERSSRAADFSELLIAWSGARAMLVRACNFRQFATQQVFSIRLDDGAVLLASASSKIVTRFGLQKAPHELSPDESLLPFYNWVDHYGYPTYKEPGTNNKRKIDRLVAEWKTGGQLPKGTIVEHKDKNRKNYHPDNLEVHIGKRGPVKKRRSLKIAPAFREANAVIEECAAASPKMSVIANKRRRKKRKWGDNHKVIDVSPGRLQPVYTADIHPEVAVSVSGVFLLLPT